VVRLIDENRRCAVDVVLYDIVIWSHAFPEVLFALCMR